MDRKFILPPALAAGIFVAQSTQQEAEAMSAPNAMISQTSGPVLTLVDWGGRGGHGYGGGWGRHGYGSAGVARHGGGWGSTWATAAAGAGTATAAAGVGMAEAGLSVETDGAPTDVSTASIAPDGLA